VRAEQSSSLLYRDQLLGLRQKNLAKRSPIRPGTYVEGVAGQVPTVRERLPMRFGHLEPT
jgi:hypothetical protein